MKRIYLDHAATTPVDPRALRAMRPYFGSSPARHARQRAGVAGWGNPGSLHAEGRAAIAALDRARETLAVSLGADFREIIFTSSATEANNLALRGVLRAFREARPGLTPKLIVSAVEHESVLETARALAREGAELVLLPVDSAGSVSPRKLSKLLDERTALVSVMYANNEFGTIEPISEISKIVADFRSSKLEALNPKQYQNSRPKSFKHSNLEFVSDLDIKISDFGTVYPLFHVDAVQAFQYLDCRPGALLCDLLTLSSHKIYGPKGAAALYKRSGFTLEPMLTGGGQEFGLRSGTENVPAVAGFARAVELADEMRAGESARLAGLRDVFWKELRRKHEQMRLNGVDISADRQGPRLPNNLNIWLPGQPAEEVVTRLDMAGISVSAGSACASRAGKVSGALTALGHSPARARQSFRLTLGRGTTSAELRRVLAVFREL